MLNVDKNEIEGIIADLIKTVSKFPDKFQGVLLEVLLQRALDSSIKSKIYESKIQDSDEYSEFILPIDVRAFFIQYNLNEDLLKKLFYIEKKQIFTLWKLQTVKKSNSQIQISLLIALENALRTGKFEFAYEEIREKCKELMVYDKTNFSSIFRYNKNNYKSFDDKKNIALSPEGKAKLANVILEITNE